MEKNYVLPIKKIEGYIPPLECVIYSDNIRKSKGDKFFIEYDSKYYTLLACARDGKVMFDFMTFANKLREFQEMFDLVGVETDVLGDTVTTLIQEDTIKFYKKNFFCEIDKKLLSKIIDTLP